MTFALVSCSLTMFECCDRFVCNIHHYQYLKMCTCIVISWHKATLQIMTGSYIKIFAPTHLHKSPVIKKIFFMQPEVLQSPEFWLQWAFVVRAFISMLYKYDKQKPGEHTMICYITMILLYITSRTVYIGVRAACDIFQVACNHFWNRALFYFISCRMWFWYI